MTNDKDKKETTHDENTSLKPDEKTLHTPDPQEKMSGPVSSTMQKIGHGFDTDETKQEADKTKEDTF